MAQALREATSGHQRATSIINKVWATNRPTTAIKDSAPPKGKGKSLGGGNPERPDNLTKSTKGKGKGKKPRGGRGKGAARGGGGDFGQYDK